MTEGEWLTCNDPQAMLDFLEHKASVRKLWLLGCTWWRAVFGRDSGETGRKMVDVIEEVADGAASHKRLRRLLRTTKSDGEDSSGLSYARFVAQIGLEKGCWRSRMWWAPAILHDRPRVASIRHVFGNPFRPVALDPGWLTADVQALAQATYENRTLPAGELEVARVCILADALEDAGCIETALLEHLRGPGRHLRGCWVVDSCLGRA